MTRFLFFFVTLSFLVGNAKAQNQPGKQLHIKKAAAPIKLDGVLDEPEWQLAEAATGFYMNYPVDSLPPTYQSEARMTFDDQFVYLSFVCFDDDKADIVQSLRRDIVWDFNDNIGIYFDPFNDFTNGFFFTITPMGVQSEGIMSGGGSSDDSFNDSWDNKWYSKVSRLHDRWIAEIAIPFKTIRYNLKEWNVTFLRNDVKRNQISSWIATPIAYIPASFAYTGKVVWDSPLPSPKSNISFIPYVSGSSFQDNEGETREYDHTANIGFDAKVGLTPSVNLDLTVNPDFSQVEVDRQVINLTRFEFGFPERRQFFLENNDLFSQPGFPDSRPFFSRRIGLALDSADKIQRVPILYGARVSGKLGKDWRIGLMNMQTAEKTSLGLPSQNYSVGVVQRQILSRSNIGFVFVNKQSLGLGQYDNNRFYHKSLLRERVEGSDTITTLNKFNRVYGVDFNLNTKDNRWQGDLFYHRSADSDKQDENYSYGAFVGYFTRNLNVFLGQQGLGKNYNAEVGFVPGLDVYPGVYGGFAQVEYRLYPKNSQIAVMGPVAGFDYFMNPSSGQLTDKVFRLEYEIFFLNTSSLRFASNNTFQRLPEDFNPLDPRGDSTLLMGQSFNWNQIGVEYRSDARKTFNYAAEAMYGGFYNGRLVSVAGEINARYQPFGSLAIRADYSHLDFPEEYGKAGFLLIGPRLDLTFTDKLFLTTFAQYNDRDDNVNLNARFQWRFKPASDFFVVYTENYLPERMTSKNRALVLKLTYWLNL
ncbi:MAG TPA: DUF5916 domain-containing protein [Chryseosolibacter sp.]